MFISIITVVLVLSLVIFVHELGHFLTAKKMGAKVEEFGFGYPPKIFGIKKGETTYSINWIPFGGFVRIKGEVGEEGKQPSKDSLLSKPIWQRAVVMAAGVGMNILLAIILYSLSFALGSPGYVGDLPEGDAQVTERKVQILSVNPDSPAEQAGLEIGDVIVSIDGQEYQTTDQINKYNQDKFGQEITLQIQNGDQTTEKKLTLTTMDEEDGPRAIMGVQLAETGLIRYPWWQAIWLGIKYTFSLIGMLFVFLFNLVKGLFMGQPVGSGVTGPIGVAFLTDKIIKLGFTYILNFVALISVNLAVFNLLPFPPLDGFRLVLLGLEKARDRRISIKTENAIQTAGFVLLIGLAIFIAVMDWRRFF